MRQTILLVSELGIGMGHASRLLAIARGLKTRGFRPVAALREPWACSDGFYAAGVPVLQTPAHRAQIPPGGMSIRSYADISASCGFQTVEALWPTILSWTALLDLVKPSAIVADYSPLATLAAFDRCPVVAVGDGFVLPPPHLPRMPEIRRTGTPMADEPTQLRHADLVMGRLGRNGPASLPSLIGGQEHVVCTYPELDLYAPDRVRPALGSLVARGGLLDVPDRPRVFVYLSAQKTSTPRVVDAALATRLPVEAHIRDADPAFRAAMREKGITLHDDAQDMAAVLRRCGVVVHHGGIGTMETCLAAGRAQVLVPSQLEQSWNAANAVRRGIARAADGASTVEGLTAIIADLALSRVVLDGAAAAARRIAGRDQEEALNAILYACERQAV